MAIVQVTFEKKKGKLWHFIKLIPVTHTKIYFNSIGTLEDFSSTSPLTSDYCECFNNIREREQLRRILYEANVLYFLPQQLLDTDLEQTFKRLLKMHLFYPLDYLNNGKSCSCMH